MKTITKKHILIVEMEILQNEVHPEHLQTQMKVLNEMSYEKYSAMIENNNIMYKLQNLIKEAKKDGSTH